MPTQPLCHACPELLNAARGRAPALESVSTAALCAHSTTRIALVALVSIVLGACEASTRPDPGYGDDAGRDAAIGSQDGGKDSAVPMRDGGGGAGGGPDAGDSGPDAMPGDGGTECEPGCEGVTPHCDRNAGECVACLEEAHCTGAASGPHCTSEGQCAECASNTHCPSAAQSYCKLNIAAPECLSCESNDHCTHIAGKPHCGSTGCEACTLATEATDCGGSLPRCRASDGACVECAVATEATDCGGSEPVCHGGTCVECTTATEAARCGGNSCDTSTHTCTTVPVGSQAACEACQSDTECGAGLGCVEHIYGQGGGAVSLGTFCFFKKGVTGCGDADLGRRPYSTEVATTSVGGEATTFCLPITSCAAVADATAMGSGGGKSCTVNSDCGASDVEDGTCRDIGGDELRCTYTCNNSYQCPQTGFKFCSGMPGYCIP